MRCLFLDLASRNGLIACVDEGQTRAVRPVDHRIGDHELLPLIEGALQEAQWSYADLTHLACVTGPGGFTSLRVGVTCANVLAHELRIPLEGVHLSDAYAARADGEQRAEVLWVHSTKKDQLFVRGGQWKEATLVSTEELTTCHSPLATHWMGELIPEHLAIVESLGMREAMLQPIATVLPPFLGGCAFAAASLEPWYGRGW